MSTPISEALSAVRSQGRLAFMPFITAGDPDLEATKRVIQTLRESGADLIEIGYPYSDPIADGPVIQASYTRALSRNVTVSQVFQALGEANREAGNDAAPLVAMVSFALIFRRGPEWFLDQARQAGVSGLIVPDLPGDEASDLFELVRSRGLDLIQLIAPTTPRARVKSILRSCSGFVYCIAVAGTTGEREKVAGDLLDQLKWLREETDLPLVVGFGISRPEHVDPLRELADGVIVGSALVRHIERLSDGAPAEDVLRSIGDFTRTMVAACQGAN